MRQSSDELKALTEADQKDRAAGMTSVNGKTVFKPFTPEQAVQMRTNDRKRRARVREMLERNLLQTGEDFDRAALIFQHGETPDDYLTAHELALIAFRMHKFSSLFALSEDRFLQSVGKVQRFGSQYAPSKNGKGYVLEAVEEGERTSVTDGLRLDWMVPPLGLTRREGANAIKIALPQMVKRLNHVFASKVQILKQQSAGKYKPYEMQDKVNPDRSKEALGLYRADKLQTARDYARVAEQVATLQEPNAALLAHELASVAFVRGEDKAGVLAASCLDRYLQSVGQPVRYLPNGRASRTVRERLI
jgi:hypothetical protein